MSDEEPKYPDVPYTGADPIDEAIAATDAKPEHLIADFTFTDGTTMKLVVPMGFDPDKFETAVAVLMQLRVAAEQAKAPRPPILVPQPGLIRPDGTRLT